MDSVKTALRVFEIVAELGDAGLTEVMRAVDAPKSTVQRGLTTLYEAGWLRPLSSGTERRRWTPSARLMTLIRGQDALVALRHSARPVLERLRDTTRETVHMTVRDGDRVVLVERFDSPQILRTVWPIGSSAPLHIGSNGKAVLATLSDRAAESYLASSLKAWTEHSLIEPDALRAELSTICARGYAISDREVDPQVRAVAAAIARPGEEAVAALSISCPASRLPESLIADYGDLVISAAAEIIRRQTGGI